MTEKETIEKILRRRAVILKDGSIDEARFRKFVTETWLYSKAVKYGFCPADKKLAQDNEIKNEPNCPDATGLPHIVDETPVETPTEDKTTVIDETPVETPTEETPVEAPVEEAPVVDETTVTEETPVEAPVEETPAEEAPVEEPAATPAKKKTSKKK